MKKGLFIKVLLAVLSISFIQTGFAVSDRIDLWVSPIRDEFTMNRGQNITRYIKVYNNTNETQTLYMSAEDCLAGSDYGSPECIPFNNPNWEKDIEKASTWITPWISGNFTIPPKWEKTVTYTISAPINASPGGHYGAVFFNSPVGWVQSSDSTISMVRRIGMLYLINISWEIVVDTNIWQISFTQNGGGSAWLSSAPVSSNTPQFLDSPVEYIKEKAKKFVMIFEDTEELKKVADEVNPFWEKPTLDTTDFQVTLKVPVENKWNTHVRPTWKIYLYDGDEQLKKIGKEAIVNEQGVFVGEKIVDYLPINDTKGNVLPNTERVFSVNWLWFAYGDMDTAWKYSINFENPSSYYSRLSEESGKFMYPWERLAIRDATKTLDAKVEMSYINPSNGKEEPYNMEVPVSIHYSYVARTTNWSAIILILGVIFLAWRIVRRRNREIDFLESEVDELESEIDALEKAQKNYTAKKTENKEVKDTHSKWKKAPIKKEEEVKPKKQRTKKSPESTPTLEKPKTVRTRKVTKKDDSTK